VILFAQRSGRTRRPRSQQIGTCDLKTEALAKTQSGL
jgi:hypothetical protein